MQLIFFPTDYSRAILTKIFFLATSNCIIVTFPLPCSNGVPPRPRTGVTNEDWLADMHLCLIYAIVLQLNMALTPQNSCSSKAITHFCYNNTFSQSIFTTKYQAGPCYAKFI